MAQQLSVWDYVIFAFMLVLSSAIGLYYGYKGRKKSTEEYLMAGQQMHWLPISVSLLASFVSAIALLGFPAEVYTFGIQFSAIVFSAFLNLSIAAHIYAPLLYRLKVTSVNEVSPSR